jgi:hypothetical protein
MEVVCVPLFPLGALVMTPGVLQAFIEAGQAPVEFLGRHILGDWGDLSFDDRKANEAAIRDGGRILSSYRTVSGVKLWVITEADRSSTCMLLPEEY